MEQYGKLHEYERAGGIHHDDFFAIQRKIVRLVVLQTGVDARAAWLREV